MTKSFYDPPNSFEDAESNAQRRTYNDHWRTGVQSVLHIRQSLMEFIELFCSMTNCRMCRRIVMEHWPNANEKRCSTYIVDKVVNYVPFLSVRKLVSAVPTYWWSSDYIRIGMLKLSLLWRRLHCWAQNVQFVQICLGKSSGFWVQSWFSGLTWVSFRTCHAFVFECWELLC